MKTATENTDLFAPLPRSARSSELLAAELCRVIVSGQIKPGDNLPSERDLAARFQVTRNTVREALRSLEKLRLVSIRQGSRITVLDYLESAGLEFVAEILDTADRPEQGLMEDIAAAWAVIGSAMMIFAVENFDRKKLPDLRRAVDEFSAEAKMPAPDVNKLQKLDFDIQNLLMRATGNRVLTFLHNSIRHIYEKIEALFSPIVANPARLAETYEKLAEHLAAGQQAKAKKLMREYFRKGRENLVRQTA